MQQFEYETKVPAKTPEEADKKMAGGEELYKLDAHTISDLVEIKQYIESKGKDPNQVIQSKKKMIKLSI